MICDFYSDPEMAVLKAIISNEGPDAIPDCVKSASTLVPSEEFRTEKRAWAWPHATMFALDTPGDIWLSAQYFKKTAHLVPIQFRGMVEENIKRAAALFDVDIDLPSEKMAKQAGQQFRPLSFPEFAYGMQKSASGEVSFQLGSAEAIKAAAIHFPAGLEEVPPFERHLLAQQIKSAADELGVATNVPLVLEAMPVKRSSLIDQMQARYAHCFEHNRRAGMIEHIQKEASEYGVGSKVDFPTYPQEAVDGYALLVEKSASIDAEDIPALVEFCSQLDAFTGLDKVAGIKPATQFLRTFVDDTAPKFVKLAGYNVPVDQILGLDALRDLIPEAYVADSTTKMAHYVEAAPEMVQKALFGAIRRNW